MTQSGGEGTGLTIGQLARSGGISVEAVRFYERKGLIERPAKPYAGIRHYSHDALKRIQFIKHAQSLGFTLQEVHEMLVLKTDEPSACAEVQRLAEDKLAVLRAKMAALRSMESVLQALVMDCRKHGTEPSPCPILEAVEEASGPEVAHKPKEASE